MFYAYTLSLHTYIYIYMHIYIYTTYMCIYIYIIYIYIYRERERERACIIGSLSAALLPRLEDSSDGLEPSRNNMNVHILNGAQAISANLRVHMLKELSPRRKQGRLDFLEVRGYMPESILEA